LRQDHRRAIVMLRSFADDGKNDYNPKGAAAQFLGLAPVRYLKWLGPLANVHPLRLFRLFFSRPNDTAEEQLTAYLRTLGPVIAIGRPGEALAIGGAARFYVSDDTWQEEIKAKISDAQLLVVQPGDSAGIWWEIEHAVRAVPLPRILFSVVHFAGAQHQYERFATRLYEETGIRLQRFIGEQPFVFIDRDRQSRSLGLTLRSYFSWPLVGCAADFKTTLAPFLGGGDQPRSRRPRWLSFVGIAAACVTWLILTTLFFVLQAMFTALLS